MKTSIIEHILKPAQRILLRAFTGSPVGSRSSIAGLLMFALCWSLVLPLIVPVAARVNRVDPGMPSQPQAPPVEAAAVRHGPVVNGGRIEGSVRQLLGENVTLNSGGTITGDLFVPGTPTVKLNGSSSYGGTISGTGSTQPTGYFVTLNGGATLGRLVNRTNPITLEVVSAPPAPQGTRNVTINSAGQSIGDPATLRDLTLNNNAGLVSVPPGTYRNFTGNGGSFVFGVAGSTQATVYNLNQITLNSGSQLRVVGPIVLTLGGTLTENGGSVGSSANPNWLTLNLAGTGVTTLNSGSALYGIVRAPNATVTLNNGTLQGSLQCDRLNVNANGTLIGIQSAPPALDSITPVRAMQSQVLSITLTGRNTHWLASQTRASFGGEVSVGGAAVGDLGLVTVVNETTAIADLTVSPTAALSPRTVRVVTPLTGGGTEDISLTEGFTVDAVTPPGASEPVVSTIAGGAGTPGFADGNGSQARFQNLTGVAIGPDDAIYVADSGNNRIRVVRGQPGSGGSTVWTVSTLAGDGTAGFADGPGASAKFNNPQGVVVDTAGVVYVADTANNRIRRIASDGSVSTLAGDGTTGLQNGAGSQARFNAPQGVAIDNQDNVYVADTGNSSVRLITGGGTVSTLAGDGSVGSNDSPGARFDGLVGIAVEGQNVYVYLADTRNHRIRRLDVTGTVVTITGAERGFRDGSASQARFAEPSGIAIDGAGKIIVADGVNSLVRAVDPDLAVNGSNQAVTTLAGTGIRGLTDGAGNVARFFTPRGLAVSNSSAIIVADSGNQVLRRILLPPIILAINPPSGRVGDIVTINGARFDGRGPERNVVRFTRSGGGTTFGSVTQATRTALTVTVPADAATGPVTVETEGGTATSPTDFVVNQFSAPVITDFNPKRGIPGTPVTLTGTNLKVNGNDPTVTFAGSNGRLPALVSSASATEVHTSVPNGAITGVIELTHVGGTAATATPFTVDSEQDFQLTVAPSTTTAVQGGSGTYLVYVTSTQGSFSQLASLTATGLPTGITATFDPAQITAGASSTLTLNLSGTIAPGAYPLTIHGVAGVAGQDVEHTAGATLNVMTSGQTMLSGRVLSTDNEPIIGATASLDGHTAMTDAAGSFLLTGVTAGANRPLMVDGRTASSPNKTYPVIIEPANIIAGQANVNPYIFYLPPIDTQYEVEVVPGQNTVAANPRVPGLQMTIPAGANLRNRDNSPVARVSITPLAIDRTPAPLPSNVWTGLVYTSQPGGAVSDIPMPVIYPNLLGINPGTQVNLYAFNHDTVQWYIYGTGTVSSDGRTIVPDINPSTGGQYGLPDFSWHFPSLPNAGQGGNGGGKGGCGGTGPTPVNYSTGIKFETSTDIAFGGARGSIELTRYYTSDNSALNFSGRFGRGVHDNFDVTLTGTWDVAGSGRVIMPDEQTGRLFNYARTDPDGSLVFTTTSTISQLGDVVRRLTDGTFEYKYRTGRTMRFDSSGRLTAIADRNGNTTTLTYTAGRLTSITDPVGRSITLAYNASGFVSTATDPIGRVWSYTYGTFGLFSDLLATVTAPLGTTTSYNYTNARLASVTDPRGNVVKALTYDNNGRVISQQFADGGVETYDYFLSGGIVTSTIITDPLGRKTTKRFNANGYLVSVVDALGQSSQLTLDLTSNLPTAVIGPCGCPEETRQYDARGNITSRTDQLGHSMTYEYDPIFNNLTKSIDKNGNITTYGYDSRGNLTSLTNALHQTTLFEVNALGEVSAVTDPLGHITTVDYDAHANVIAIADALSHRWEMEFDGVSRRTATEDPLGRRIVTEYDSLNRTKKITDTSGIVTQYEYDQNGNQTQVKDGLNRIWKTIYDAKNRPSSQTDPLGRTARSTYTLDDKVILSISPSGRKTLHEYDSVGREIRLTGPLGDVVRFAYDNRGNLARLTDERGNATTWIYDTKLRPVSVRDPLGKIISIQYDPQGNVKKRMDQTGRETNLNYDPLNRIQQILYPDAQVSYGYDAAGRLETISDSQGGTISYTYDDGNRASSETTALGVVAYEYNDTNQRTKMTALDRPPVFYGYDAAGRLQAITQGAGTFSIDYDGRSRRKSLTRPNGVVTDFGYDETSRLQRITHSLGQQIIEDYQYVYSLDNEISSISSLSSGTVLTQPKTAGAANNANRIAQLGNVSYSFNDLGQTKTRSDNNGTTSYEWDARERLTQATLPNGQTVNYSYDALGRRTSRTVNSSTTSFLYDGQNVVLDKTAAGVTADYVNGWGIDLKLKQTSSAGEFYFLQDQLNSTTALTNSSGGVTETLQYQAFGDGPGSSLTRYAYSGRERDELTGLYHYRARWYDPQQGRFTSQDPIGFGSGQLNLYVYVSNSPLGARDPFGQTTLQVGWSGSLILGPVALVGGIGIAIDGQGNVGIYYEGGGGGGAGARANTGTSIHVSSGDSIRDLSGQFYNGSIGAGKGVDGSLDGFTGLGERGQRVYGGGVTLGGGLGAGGSVTSSWTGIIPLFNLGGGGDGDSRSNGGRDCPPGMLPPPQPLPPGYQPWPPPARPTPTPSGLPGPVPQPAPTP